MNWIIWGVGCVAIVGVSAGLITVCLFAIVALLEKLQTRQDSKTRELAAADLGNDMFVNAYWFSEDEPTMKLLKSIGEKIVRSRSCTFEPGEIRDEWRKSRELASATSTERSDGQ